MLIAAVMVAVALACVLVPLLRIGKGDTVARDMSNVAIVRDQVRELEADLAAGTISQDRHDEARRELDRRVLDDAAGTDITPRAPTQAAAWTAALLASAIPIAALLLYAVLGSHEAFSPATAAKGFPMTVPPPPPVH